MTLSRESLRGYLLEEALAYLIRRSGYRLLVDEGQDPESLRNRGNGLVVLGRGSEHQADVLGELVWFPAFTYPLRLFVEAKFQSEPVGISNVRNAVGIIQDLNQNLKPMRQTRILLQRYTYNYVIFSASGFSRSAVNMALAHGVSLVDLQDSGFDHLLTAVDQAALSLLQKFGRLEEGSPTSFGSKTINALRRHLRQELGTWPEDVRRQVPTALPSLDHLGEILTQFVNRVREIDEVFLGVVTGPFVLILKAEDPRAFLRYARSNPSHRVSIHWRAASETSLHCWVEPIAPEPHPYRLYFSLPRVLTEWILEVKGTERHLRAFNVKTQYLSDITVYYRDRNDELFRLQYDPHVWSVR